MSSITGGGGSITGTLMDWPATTAPTGWLFCDGSAISRTAFSALFALIGSTYGAGDGSTTFNVPDFRGRVSAGKDDMGGVAANRLTTAGSGVDGATLAANGGAENHTLTIAQMPSHQHDGIPAGGGFSAPFASGSNAQGTGVTAAQGGGGAHNNTQPTLVVNKIIKT